MWSHKSKHIYESIDWDDLVVERVGIGMTRYWGELALGRVGLERDGRGRLDIGTTLLNEML